MYAGFKQSLTTFVEIEALLALRDDKIVSLVEVGGPKQIMITEEDYGRSWV